MVPDDLGETEIDNLEVRVRLFRLEQEVLWLEISVRDALIVAVVERMQDLFENLSGVLLGEELVLDDTVKQLATSANLSDKVHVLVIVEVLIELEHVRMIQLLQDENLLLEPIHVLDLFLGNLLDCALLLGLAMHAQRNDTVGASAQGLLRNLVDVLNLRFILTDHGGLANEEATLWWIFDFSCGLHLLISYFYII